MIDDFKYFAIEGIKVGITASETAYGNQALGEIFEEYYYLGDRQINIYTAIDIWQKVNGIVLSEKEIYAVLLENGLASE